MINTIIDIYHGDDVRGEDFVTVTKGGTIAIIHKASQGPNTQDPAYALRRVKATRAGLLWGAYHFATGADGIQQAETFLRLAQPEPTTLMALDLERNPSGSTVTLQQARNFVQHIYAVTGRFPYIYGSDVVSEFAGSHGDPVLSQCPLWIARYGHQPVVPPGWTKWTLWQYLAGESKSPGQDLPGVGYVDRNWFEGSIEELKKVWAA